MSSHLRLAFLAVSLWLFTGLDPCSTRGHCGQEEPCDQTTETVEPSTSMATGHNCAKQSGNQVPMILLGSAIAVALIGLTGSLLWSQIRLREVSRQLAVEQNTSARNQKMIKDQSLRLQHTERLGAVARDIAHDFNNLLVGVMFNAETLESRDELDDFSKKRIQLITVSARKAAELSQQLLANAAELQTARKVNGPSGAS